MKKLIKSPCLVDLYGNSYVFYANGSHDTLYDEIKKVADEWEYDNMSQYSAGYAFQYNHKDYPYFSVWVREVDYSSKFYSILNHEVFHMAHAALGYRDITLGKDSEEAYAYMIGYLTRCYLDWVNKKVRKKK